MEQDLEKLREFFERTGATQQRQPPHTAEQHQPSTNLQPPTAQHQQPSTSLQPAANPQAPATQHQQATANLQPPPAQQQTDCMQPPPAQQHAAPGQRQSQQPRIPQQQHFRVGQYPALPPAPVRIVAVNNPSHVPVTGGVAIALCVPTQRVSSSKRKNGERGPDKPGTKRQRKCRLCCNHNPSGLQVAMKCKGRTRLGIDACEHFNVDGSPKI